MDMITISEKTLDEAITKALIELQTTSEHLHYEVVQKESPGILGLFAKPCIIRARIMSEEEERNLKKQAQEAAKAAQKAAEKEKQAQKQEKPETRKEQESRSSDRNDKKQFEKKPLQKEGEKAYDGAVKHSEKLESGRTDHSDRNANDRGERTDRKERFDRGNRSGHERGERFDRGERGGHEHGERFDRGNRGGSERGERFDRGERGGSERGERFDRGERGGNERGDKRRFQEPREAKPIEKKEKKEFHVDEAKVKKDATDFLNQVFGAMGMEVSLEARFDAGEGELLVMMNGEDMGILIGKRGQTLDSLQYLVSLVVNKDTEGYLRVKLDTENYRERRKETLETLARNISYKVKRTKHPVSLEPMNPYERRIIHSALQNDRYVVTRSEGEDPYRHVVISLKRDSYGDGRRGRYNNSRRDRYPDRNGDRPVRNGERNKDRASGQDTDKVIEKAVEKTVESPAAEIAE